MQVPSPSTWMEPPSRIKSLLFTSPGHVVLAWTEEEGDVQYAMSRACLEYLEQALDARGRRLKSFRAIRLSLSQGKYRPSHKPPQALNPQSTPRTSPWLFFTKVGARD